MSVTNERIFIIGGTGNVGERTVKAIAAKKVPITVLSRDPSKAQSTFSSIDASLLTVVKGGYDDLDTLKQVFPGHTRLFLLINHALGRMVQVKGAIARLAFASGIKQIVDLSSSGFGIPLYDNYLLTQHTLAEQAILDAAADHDDDRYVVLLRPTRFMTNLVTYYRPGLNDFEDTLDPDEKQSWISPNDIAGVAAYVLTDAMANHATSAYELTSQVITPTERAAILSRVLGRSYTYRQISPADYFSTLSQSLANYLPIRCIYDIATMVEHTPHVSRGISIFLGREPETLEAFLTANKHLLP
ncbi:uncharacterized protein BX664DRAFT_336634 [Halteromyces radiatus]|uniref:uncharacterized protein n=1 Tax=Halteromyces radiatus TaxID=101107 RepID=UPI0022202C7C|nr:uncharacterized protein BX664DRAFT_336634 [Halteromyces radiatus]KAI8086735.1 hypothetical protein BX664DRAFT_336634 [Halteromyces radiatus]